MVNSLGCVCQAKDLCPFFTEQYKAMSAHPAHVMPRDKGPGRAQLAQNRSRSGGTTSRWIQHNLYSALLVRDRTLVPMKNHRPFRRRKMENKVIPISLYRRRILIEAHY